MRTSHRWLLLSPLLLPLWGPGLLAEEKAAPREIQAPITSVTVYSDRARVTRTSEGLTLGPRTLLKVSGLPDGMADDSVRVSLPGHPSAQVLSVDVERRFLDKFTTDDARKRQEAVRALEEEGQRLAAREGALAREAELLQGLAVGAQPNPGQQGQTKTLTPEGWGKVLDAVAADLAVNAKSRLEAAATRRDWERRLASTRQALQEVQAYHRTAEKVLTVEIAGPAQPKGAGPLEVSYLIGGARWTPSYDVRVLPAESRIQVVRHAVVQQGTGEDWTDAALVFSTAIPAVSATLPDLMAWRIMEAEVPRPAPAAPPMMDAMEKADSLREERDGEGYEDKNAAVSGEAKTRFSSRAKGSMENGRLYLRRSRNAEDLRKPKDALDEFSRWVPPCQLAAGYDYAFPALKPETVKSDGSSRRVALGTDSFPAALRYEAAPLVSPFAYLACDLKNDSKAPYLAGESNIFLGGDFLGAAELGTVGLGETATVPLGVDEKIKVTRKARDLKGSAGLFNTKERTCTEVEICATSFLKAPVTLRLLDRLPYAFQDDIQVEEAGKATPAPSEKTPKGILVWNLALTNAQPLTVTFSYAVKTPDDFDLSQTSDPQGAK